MLFVINVDIDSRAVTLPVNFNLGVMYDNSCKTITFMVQKFDSSHVAIKSWGSEDIIALVGSHSHADKAIEELYPSVLEELKQKVNNPNLTDEQLNNIATKVAEKGFYTKTEIDSMIADIVVPTRLSQLADDTNVVEGSYVVKTTYTEDDTHIFEHYEWAKYEDTEPVQELTIEERLTETESNVTELQMVLCDIYENMGGDTNA